MKRFVLPRKLFIRHREEDFDDYGNKFRIYYYKDKLPIVVCVYKGYAYLCMRADYLGYRYTTYKKDYGTLNKYNGEYTTEYILEHMDELIADCESMMKEYCD